MNCDEKETPREEFYKKVTFKFFAIFTAGKHLCCSLFLLKLQEKTPTQVLPVNIKILKNTYFEEHVNRCF